MKNYFILLFLLIFYSHSGYSDIHYKNASQKPMAQSLFDKGMLNYYGYLYVQAEYDFSQALSYDPQCGICYWGLAVARKQQALELGKPFGLIGVEYLTNASRLISPNDAFLYELVQATKGSFSKNKNVTSKQLQLQYINNLRQLYRKYKESEAWRSESLALFVDAIAYSGSVNDEDDVVINHCTPIQHNDLKQEALDLLVHVLNKKSYPDHPGLLHTYIHMAERNLTDKTALIAAKKIPSFSNQMIAHYTHMPTHVYWRRGLYDEAIAANLAAIKIDENYFKHNGAGLLSYYYDYHFLHSHHFLTALGMLTNNFDLALHYAQEIKQLMDANRMEGLINYQDTLLSLEHIVLARFKKWSDVLELEVPEQSHDFALLFVHFTKALAYLHLQQEDKFQKIYDQISQKEYFESGLPELKTLVLSYLKASQMNVKHASISELEEVFLKAKVDKIENKLSSMNPPLWYFSYQLFLWEAAQDRADSKAAKKYRLLYEKRYPKSTLGL